MMGNKIEHTVTKGSVFNALDLPTSQEDAVRVRLAVQISNLIKKRKLNQTQAAALLGISQGDVSKLRGGHLQHFSISRLISFIDLLGQEVKVTFKPKAALKTKVKKKVAAKKRKKKVTEAA